MAAVGTLAVLAVLALIRIPTFGAVDVFNRPRLTARRPFSIRPDGHQTVVTRAGPLPALEALAAGLGTGHPQPQREP